MDNCSSVDLNICIINKTQLLCEPEGPFILKTIEALKIILH